MNIYKDWKAKLESAYSFMLKYSKTTVWGVWQNLHVYFAFQINDAQKDWNDRKFHIIQK